MKKKEMIKKTMVLAAMFAMTFTFSGVNTQAAATPALSKTSITVKAGKTKKIKVKKSKGKKVRWTSKDKEIATVSKTGKVKGKKAGKTVIIAKVGKKKLKCKIVVKATINKKKIALKEGNTYTLKVKGLGDDVTWTSSDESIATVEKTGKNSAVVTGIKKGPCTVTAVSGKNKVKCTVLVKHVIEGTSTPVEE